MYRAVQQRLGLQRVLVVQSSTHGTDHACLLDALTQLGPGARGVGMVDAGVTEAELRRLGTAGVVAARFLMTPGGVVAWDEAPRLAARVAEAGWLVNLQVRGEVLTERLDTVAAMAGPVVIDHMGNYGPVDPDGEAFGALLRLLDTGRVWVKLSAPYARGAMGPFPYAAAAAVAQALVRHAPERLLWGSDWPHTFLTEVHHQPAPDPQALFGLLGEWAEDAGVRRRILVDTPDTLFSR